MNFGVEQPQSGGEFQAVGRLPVGGEFRAVGMDFFGVADDDGVGAEIEGELHVAVVVQKQVAGELQAAVGAAPAGVPLVVVHIFGFSLGLYVVSANRARTLLRSSKVLRPPTLRMSTHSSCLLRK